MYFYQGPYGGILKGSWGVLMSGSVSCPSMSVFRECLRQTVARFCSCKAANCFPGWGTLGRGVLGLVLEGGSWSPEEPCTQERRVFKEKWKDSQVFGWLFLLESAFGVPNFSACIRRPRAATWRNFQSINKQPCSVVPALVDPPFREPPDQHRIIWLS